jgi:hypothetical protein
MYLKCRNVSVAAELQRQVQGPGDGKLGLELLYWSELFRKAPPL